MKIFLLSAFLTVISVAVMAQHVSLSGEIKKDRAVSLQLFLLHASPHTMNTPIRLYPDKQGFFKAELQLEQPTIGIFEYGMQRKRLLLSAGRNIHLILADSLHVKVAGKAQKENELMELLGIGSTPLYNSEEAEEQVDQKIDWADKQIAAADIPSLLKFVLQKELHFYNQCILYNRAKQLKGEEGSRLMRYALQMEEMPGIATLAVSPFANRMLENSIRETVDQTATTLKKNKEEGKKALEALFKMPFDDLIAQTAYYDEDYIIPWLFAKQHITTEQKEKLLFNKIMQACSDKNLPNAESLLDTLRVYYPDSHLSIAAMNELVTLAAITAQQELNANINIHNRKITSLADLVAPYKGKWVYLDIWGTWCGPCKTELKYVPAFKQKWTKKNLMFVYVDLDENSKDKQWRDFVKIMNMEGEHYRATRQEFNACWEEIKAAGGDPYKVPTYLLFDQHGKMVVAGAERPSKPEALIEQIETAMKQ